MAKQILFNGAARSKMLRGIDKLARAVEVTLGASGPGVVIQHRTDGILPIFTRDGVTVARSIVLSDCLEEVGARMLRDVACAVSRQAGDGTTTAIVLAHRIALECSKSLAAGAHPVELKKGIDLAVGMVCSELQRKALRSLDLNLLRKVCKIASKEEEQVADLLVEALDEIGPNGALSIEMGHERGDRLEIVDGAHFEQGFLSPYFTTDRDRGLAELEDPYLLLYDREITDFMDLVPLLEQVQEQHRSLLIIAENLSERALAALLLNHVRGNFRAVAVKPPGHGDRRQERLLDLAALTGGTACLEVSGDRLDRLSLADLGQASRAVIDAESTTLLGGRGEKGLIEERIAGLEWEAERIRARKPGEGSITGKRHDLEELEDRIRLLRGRTAVYKVGGGSEMEIKERMVRVENAYHSIQAALEEGVLAGGGVGLLSLRKELDRLQAAHPDRQRGIGIVRAALCEPLRRIAGNAGLNPEEVLAEVLSKDDGRYGFDASSHSFGNLIERGIVDPVKVTRLALQNAAGIVGTVIMTEAVISEQPILERLPNSAAIAEWAAATREDPRI
ncbi:MAG: chaperonin GroEL [Methylococcaceae bacterium]|nr:chaperonin GroEL [Methylococcaceae bacterium]